MAQALDFLCPLCKKVHPVSSIAFSIPDGMFKDIQENLGEEFTVLIGKYDIFRCLTVDAVERQIPRRMWDQNTATGSVTLTKGWFRRRAELLKEQMWFTPGSSESLALERLEELDDDAVLCDKSLSFRFTPVGDELIPWEIRSVQGVPLSTVRRCAHCGRVLSPVTGTAPEIRVVLQGSTRAGKSSLLVSMFNELLHSDTGADYGIEADMLSEGGDKCTDWLLAELEWYRKGYNIQKTSSNQKEPDLYSLRLKVDGKPLILSLLDMPGEFFDGEKGTYTVLDNKWFQQYSEIYTKCAAIWTHMQYHMLNKIQNDDVNLKQRIHAANGTSDEVLARTTYEMYSMRFQKIREDIVYRNVNMPPHAVILTKTDAIADGIPHGEQEKARLTSLGIFPYIGNKGDRSPYYGNPNEALLFGYKAHTVYSEQYAFKRAYRVREYLREISPRMYQVLDRFSERRGYFAISAYGQACVRRSEGEEEAKQAKSEYKADEQRAEAGRQQTKFTPSPYNVLAPLFWTLATSGYLHICYNLKKYVRKKTFGGNRTDSEHTSVIRSWSKVDPQCVRNLYMQTERYIEHEENA